MLCPETSGQPKELEAEPLFCPPEGAEAAALHQPLPRTTRAGSHEKAPAVGVLRYPAAEYDSGGQPRCPGRRFGASPDTEEGGNFSQEQLSRLQLGLSSGDRELFSTARRQTPQQPPQT